MLLIGYAADGFPVYAAYGHIDAKDVKSPLKKMRSSYKLREGERAAGAPSENSTAHLPAIMNMSKTPAIWTNATAASESPQNIPTAFIIILSSKNSLKSAGFGAERRTIVSERKVRPRVPDPEVRVSALHRRPGNNII